MSAELTNSKSAWPHRLAVLLVCATFPLIWVGGLVTTTQAGMAVPDWPSTYGYNLFLYPWTTWLLGPWDLFIEHGHRLLGALVGMITIALALAIAMYDARLWMKWLGLFAVPAVIAQGVLGGMRVLLDERTLAKIHGCTGPAFFALTVALAVLTSKWWREAPSQSAGQVSRRLGSLAGLTALLAYGQLVLGAQIRHVAPDASPQVFNTALAFHLLVAGVLTLHVVLLAAVVAWSQRRNTPLVRPAAALAFCLALQLFLGAGTWIMKYGWPFGLGERWNAGFTIAAGSFAQSITVTAHVATGSLILVLALVLAMRCGRLVYCQSRRRANGTMAAAAWPVSFLLSSPAWRVEGSA